MNLNGSSASDDGSDELEPSPPPADSPEPAPAAVAAALGEPSLLPRITLTAPPEDGGDEVEMDSQPATQPVLDPRRLGRNNSGLSQADLSDVLVILHPTTASALQLVEELAKTSPQHILQNEDLLDGLDDGFADVGDEVELEYATRIAGAEMDLARLETADVERHADVGDTDATPDGAPAPERAEGGSPEPDTQVVAAEEQQPRPGRDIALRLSSAVRDLTLGFVFGRVAHKCDVQLCRDEGNRFVSQQQFRIYVNAHGSLMLQDMSTNGVWIDRFLLRTKVHPGAPQGQKGEWGSQRMLQSGATISVLCGKSDVIRFVVRIPSRLNHEDAFQASLEAYMDRVIEAQRLRANPPQPPPTGAALFPGFPTPPNAALTTPPNRSSLSMYQLARGWDGGPNYNVIGTAGKGAFATVWKIATKRDGDVYAAKEISKRQFIKDGIFDRKVDNEMRIMRRLRHRHIVQYIEHLEDKNNMYIVMEYVPGGDLGSIINETGPLPEGTVKEVARQTLLALEYLHRRKITHRDIKPDNLLIVREDPIEIKLSDFGLSKVIESQESMLKTFCGTLLYCAPEVFSRYPEYVKDAYNPAKRRRPGRKSGQPHHYNQACDMWSFAAVLFMALTGKGPYTAESGDKDFMLDKIMTTELDVGPLRRRGVSEEGVRFLRRLLNVRPELRPLELECLRDPWLDDGSGPMDMELENAGWEVVDDGDDGELDASQLSIDGDEGSDGDGRQEAQLDSALPAHQRGPKRARTTGTFAPRDYPDFPSSPDDSSPIMPSTPSKESYGLPDAASEVNRLFGEVGASALGSSGVIPYGQLNLGMPIADAREERGFGEVQPVQSTARLQRQNAQSLLAPPEVPAPLAPAPSLLGAEALVGQLNVASPSPGSTPGSSMAPTTPKTREPSPISPGKQRDEHGGPENPGNEDEAPKRFVRRINLPIPDSYYYDPYDKSTHNAEHAAKMRALEGQESQTGAAGARGSGESSKDNGAAQSVREQDAQIETDPATTEEEHPKSSTADTSFARPLPILGKLTTTRESCIDVTINITQRATSWGRGGGNTVIYPDGADTLIPKYAFDILFWRAGLAEEMARGLAWTEVPDVPAMIMTRTSLRIFVNGVKLVRREKEGNPYGALHTGDVITIFRGSGKELEFRCEFYHGASARPRPVGAKPFEIRHADFEGGGQSQSQPQLPAA
ncbi:MAG: hypothetical protein M1832_001332 [Thelocarpon impressellum]|nr:MAG: hypothetical protein M1832_001332 [Thelocarpon impressellum]